MGGRWDVVMVCVCDGMLECEWDVVMGGMWWWGVW